MYQLIHYYKFFPINNVQQFWLDHKLCCLRLKLKGRIYIAGEGINGSVCGNKENIAQYKSFLLSQEGFPDTQFKEEICDFIPFFQLKVKIRPEIVALKDSTATFQKSLNTLFPEKRGIVPHTTVQQFMKCATTSFSSTDNAAQFLEPNQWRKVLESEKDFVLLDVRNQYESKIGHFAGALIPPVENFFDFPDWLKTSGINRKKKVLMYCTGGIRCEKFSMIMKREGFEEVYQLKGGIINYAHKENGAHFKGKCFVFDDRLAIPVNLDEVSPIACCQISGVPCDTYINCANCYCNKLFICSKESAIQMEGCCCDDCRKSPYKRPFNVDNVYSPYRKWYPSFH